ncbi:MAK10-like protein [Tanacetum coccineum]
MGDVNPIRTLGDYSRPSHEGYRNTIDLPKGNNVVPLRSDTIRLVQNGCSFHGLRFEDPNQHLKDFLKLMDSLDLDVANRERTRLRLFQSSLRDQASNWLERHPAGSISTWEYLTTRFLAQFFPPGRTTKLLPHHDIDLWLQVKIFYDRVNPATRRTIDQSVGGKLRDKNAKESWALLEDLALYDNESWNDRRDFAKPVKQPAQVNKITSSCEICSGPHDTQYCMENPEQAFVDYASSRTDEAGGKLYTFKLDQNNLEKGASGMAVETARGLGFVPQGVFVCSVARKSQKGVFGLGGSRHRGVGLAVNSRAQHLAEVESVHEPVEGARITQRVISQTAMIHQDGRCELLPGIKRLSRSAINTSHRIKI